MEINLWDVCSLHDSQIVVAFLVVFVEEKINSRIRNNYNIEQSSVRKELELIYAAPSMVYVKLFTEILMDTHKASKSIKMPK